ncbi:hypothetical protein ALC56_06121, partial [Trachymyrmex septentrionalis]
YWCLHGKAGLITNALINDKAWLHNQDPNHRALKRVYKLEMQGLMLLARIATVFRKGRRERFIHSVPERRFESNREGEKGIRGLERTGKTGEREATEIKGCLNIVGKMKSNLYIQRNAVIPRRAMLTRMPPLKSRVIPSQAAEPKLRKLKPERNIPVVNETTYPQRGT